MKPNKPFSVRESDKVAKRKKKRNLANSTLIKFFGEGPENIWEKDIYTGEGNFSFWWTRLLSTLSYYISKGL